MALTVRSTNLTKLVRLGFNRFDSIFGQFWVVRGIISDPLAYIDEWHRVNVFVTCLYTNGMFYRIY